MAKILDLNRTVFELAEEYPELIEVMEELGFSEITKKAMLHSVGKLMTVPRGAKMKQIPMENVMRAFTERGFEIVGMENTEQTSSRTEPVAAPSDSRTEQLKAYLRRLGDGEALEKVRADFVRDFGEVDASEIMKAEQELLQEGTPLTEVQKLCDVHSALFHGATKEEQIINAEQAVEEALKRQEAFPKKDYSDKTERAAALEALPGHPLQTLTKENNALSSLLEETKQALAQKGNVSALLGRLREVSIHYAKKGDLLYPHLKVKYGISGPSDVMWTVDDEIRDELGALEKESNRDEWWHTRFGNVLNRAEEMIYKEQNILFPICAVNFTEDEWKEIYRDAKDYAVCFGVESRVWEAAEQAGNPVVSASAGEIVMPGGHMTLPQLTALLNTIPLEISFVDADNINRYFNEGPKVFKRPGMAIDREVFSCHPPKIEPMVRSIIDDFRNGRRDSVPVWMDKGGRTMLVTYMAVRDQDKNYLGTVELVQDMEFAKAHFGVKT
ncbi:MAG: DUF438 domain-containing protein [Anaerotignum sp.]|nr:DUF438 domain-containing protein [Anaerotignum sp.]